MRKLLILALLAALSAPAWGLDRSPRKKKRDKKSRSEQTVPATVSDTLRTVCPEPVEEPTPPVAEEPELNDITLGLSAEQADSLLAVWR